MKFTNQQTFDKIVRHLRKQNSVAKESDGSCSYLASDGKKCAAGCLITKGEYRPEFEGKSVSDIDGRGLTEVGKFIQNKGHNIRLVRVLQDVHDNKSICFWEEEFKNVARRFRVKYVPRKTSKTLS